MKNNFKLIAFLQAVRYAVVSSVKAMLKFKLKPSFGQRNRSR